jgi:membrane protein DedA with SNARE-associated domain
VTTLKLTLMTLYIILGFVLGAYLPVTLSVIFVYIRNEWKNAIRSLRSFIRLLWGVVLRIVASFAMLFVIFMVVGILAGVEPKAVEKDITAALGFSVMAGFLGSIALFIFGYFYGRRQRRRESLG